MKVFLLETEKRFHRLFTSETRKSKTQSFQNGFAAASAFSRSLKKLFVAEEFISPLIYCDKVFLLPLKKTGKNSDNIPVLQKSRVFKVIINRCRRRYTSNNLRNQLIILLFRLFINPVF